MKLVAADGSLDSWLLFFHGIDCFCSTVHKQNQELEVAMSGIIFPSGFYVFSIWLNCVNQRRRAKCCNRYGCLDGIW